MKLYVDASALVKLVMEEDGSDVAEALVNRAGDVVCSRLGYVEVRSALARAATERRLLGRLRQRARSDLEELWNTLTALELDPDLVARAGDVAEFSRVRAGNAVHLASALRLDEPDLLFVTWDRDLQRAAREAGLAVAP